MNKVYNYIFAFILLISVSSYAQYTISGYVKDAATGESLVGANVFLKGTSWGAASDVNGNYSITAEAGTYTITCSYIGYEKIERQIKVSGDLTENFSLKEYQFSLSVTVISDRVKERETPVAYTNVDKEQISFNLGSKDIPLVLNTTPSVFATDNGGGAGDARINLRGFDQRNVNIMINGMPINDMENGWVYWSNWDGLGDATSSIQVQRGLSAVNLATPSIGGTVNIITDPTMHKAGVFYKNEVGSAGFNKQTLFGHTGLIDGKFALSIGGVRKTGDGVVDRAWTDAWAYYLGTAYQINNNNRLELYALGAPQQHGQRTFRLNAATFSHELARELGFPEAALNDPRLAEQGILYNSNWSPVNTSYQGLQWQRSYWNNDINQRYNPAYINERVNYFHKPLVNLNWYSQLAGDLSLYSTVYWSGGQGGGSGTFGSIRYNTKLLQRVVDWNATIANNLTHIDTVDFGNGPAQYIISNNISNDPNRGGILRNSVNDQWTIGLISKAYWKTNENLTLSFGVDGRYAEIEHFREVRDLLGNDYYYWDGNDFESGLDYYKKLGDRIDYNNTNTVNWLGGYLQGEYTRDLYTLYLNGGLSTIKFDYTDHFRMTPSGGELNLVTDWILGYQFKGGASFRTSELIDLYANAGYVSKVPIFDQVISDVDGTMIENPDNEKFLSFELGANGRFIQNRFNVNGNVYFTNWTDRAVNQPVINPDGSDGLVRLQGVSSRHMGFELAAAYQPVRVFRLDAVFTQGIWEYTEDISGTYIVDFTTGATEEYNYYLKDIKVGGAPQTQLVTSVTIFPFEGFQAQLLWRYYDNYYSEFDPFSRTNPDDREQVWQIPAYSLFDLHFSYKIGAAFGGLDVTLFAHVFNLFDKLYVEDATDNSSFNAWSVDGLNHKADDAEIYPGLPRIFNIGFSASL